MTVTDDRTYTRSSAWGLDSAADDPEQWRDLALCREVDPEIFFPEKGGSARTAKSICSRCEVASQCLEFALENDERFGVYGGLSERDRWRLKRGISAPPHRGGAL